MQQLTLLTFEQIEDRKEVFVKQNAFIKPDGSFYIAYGYTGCNPWQQLERSALLVGRQEIGKYFVEKYYDWLKCLEETNKEEYERSLKRLRQISNVEKAPHLYDKRSILVQFYGFVLFCRTEVIRAFNDRDKFFEQSLIPDPELYGKEITEKQKDTLKKFFDLNEEQNVTDFDKGKKVTDKDEILKLVLENKTVRKWHH